MGELFGEKDYILDAEELRTWIRILEEPIHYGHAEREASGCALREEPLGSEPRSVVIMPRELPQGYEVLKENFAAPQRPEMSCAQQIGALIEGLKDMVNSVSSNAQTTAASPESFGVQEAATKLGCSPGQVRKLVRTGLLTYHRMGKNLRFRQEDITNFWASQTVERRDTNSRGRRKGAEEKQTRKQAGKKTGVDRASLKERMSKWE